MKLLHRLSLVLIILISPFSSTAFADAKPVAATITVVNEESNIPVSGALLSIVTGSGKPKQVTTDGTGKARLELSPATYQYTVRKEGFAVRKEYLLLEVKPVEVTVPLQREAQVSGRVVTTSGKPVAGVTVTVSGESSAKTGSDGRFLVRGVEEGWQTATIEDKEWIAQRSTPFQVKRGERRELADLKMLHPGRLTVRVVGMHEGRERAITWGSASVYGAGYDSKLLGKNGITFFSRVAPGEVTVDASGSGFAGKEVKVTVAEGEEKSVTVPVKVHPLELSLYEFGEVYLPQSRVKFRLKGVWNPAAQVRVYSVSKDDLVAGRLSLQRPDEIPPASLRQVKKMPVRLNPPSKGSSLTRATVTLPLLPSGAYVVEAQAGSAKVRSAFQVTRLGLVAKVSPTSILLFASDLSTGKALSGVSAAAFPAEGTGKESFLGVTGADGLISIPFAAGELRVVGSSGENLAFLNVAAADLKKKNELAGFLYTERPAYRPGQTVYFKGVLRKRVGDDYALPGVSSVQLKVTDSHEQTVLEREVPLTKTGALAGEFPLAADGALGEYTVTVRSGETEWRTTFDVLEYRKPEFEVKAAPARPYVLSGDPAEFTLVARTYTGGPVAAAPVKYSVYAQQSYRYGEGEEEVDYAADGYADFIHEGETVTDETGKAVITVPTTEAETEMVYRVEMTVTDAASRQITASASIPVVPSLIALDVRAEQYVTSPGVTIPVAFTAKDRDGKPVSTTLVVGAAEERYDGKTGKQTIFPLEPRKLTTDKSGRAVDNFTFPRPGFWRLAALTADSRGRIATGFDTIWVWKQGHSWQSVWRELEMEFDKKSYRIGETAKLLIRTPATGGTLLLTLEGRDVYQRRTIALSGSVELVEIPVTKDFAPLLYVSAVTVHDRRFYSRTASLKVQDQPHSLAVTVEPERPVYAPGDTVNLALSTMGADGKPRPAELSVGVVDESIYAISGEKDVDIHRFFRGSREHLVETFHSFPRVYLGGASKDKAMAPAPEAGGKIKIRKLFKDTSFWNPEVATDSDGKGNVSFRLPDNLTTWCATAIAHTGESAFGTGRGKFISRLDVMARLAPPRFFIQGDELSVPGLVTNMTGEERPVKGRFAATGLTLLAPADFAQAVPAGATARHDLPVRAESPGEAMLRLTADAGDRGDALELTVPVFQKGIDRKIAGNMVVKETSATTSVDLPADALPGSATLDITFAPTLLASLGESIRELVEFPYGCVEQTMSRFLPAVYVRGLATTGRAELPPDLATKLPEVVDSGLRRLYDFQHEDGGWGWWKEDSTSPAMTAYVIYGLSLARKAGVPIRTEAMEKGVAALRKIIVEAGGDLTPYAYRALTLAGARERSVEEMIDREWDRIAPPQRIFYIEALLNLGEGEKAQRLLAELKRSVVREGTAARVKVDDEVSRYSEPWAGSAVEATAALLENMVRISPADPLAPSLAEYLVRKRVGRWWGNTRATALVIKSLADFSGESGSYDGRLLLNDREIERFSVRNGKLAEGRSRIALPMADLIAGTNRLKFERNNASGAAFVAGVLSHRLPLERAAGALGLTVTRTASRLATRKEGESWMVDRLPLKGEALRTGDEVEVELTVANRESLDYVIIEDPLPAGFEVRETSDDGRFAGDDYDGWSTHRERHDEKMAFFITSLPPGEHRFRYLVKPELAGKMVALPAAVWPMYRPELRGESAAWHVTVESGKR
ncbi:carboxypeptidase regulatory-like domain-containing protein [Pelotalea chapellei]|uniref:Carboxypeptidase regulatory-like domain-containing protein n=1 Tax=Pelotalea chapellei TaxID=44671 RepID=A0ABS5U620_9BACT|nr:carboxypeptidase regulatory-like domain-containing protein [Pelotalea chapellei]MBT1071106.1 carboxypeptidase regulatory-like domain-containing protein [Pelotalea chapellei]